MYKIEYKGKSINTSNYLESTQEVFEDACKEYLAKPDIESVKKELMSIIRNGTQLKCNTNKYFLQEVHDKVIVTGQSCKWCIEDVFQYKPLFDVFYAKIQDNKKVFTDDMTVTQKVLKSIDLGGAGIVKKATYYPIENVRHMINKYCKKGGVYYDYSCGWGDRMLGAMSCGVEYHGTDPNYMLVEQLHKINEMAREVAYVPKSTNIYCQGSEYLIPQLVGKVDFSFSSPPYFDLEDYRIGEQQSYKEGTSYDNWLNFYMKPTIENIYKYLKEDGYYAINIKNSDKHALLDDCINIAKLVGFKFLGYEELEIIGRTHVDGGIINGNEMIAVFSKGAEMPKENKVVELW